MAHAPPSATFREYPREQKDLEEKLIDLVRENEALWKQNTTSYQKHSRKRCYLVVEDCEGIAAFATPQTTT